MKSVTFELQPEELDSTLIDSIKMLFKGKKVKITVMEDLNPSATRKSLTEIIEENKKSKTVVELTSETLDLLAEKLQNEEDEEFLQILENHRVER